MTNKRTVFELLNQAVKTYADKKYLSQKIETGWENTSFKEAKTKAKVLASAFIELGISYEDKVAILSEAKTDWIIAEFATLYAGAIAVPLSIKLLSEEVPFRVNHSDSKLFIISENTLEKVISNWSSFDNKSLRLIILDKPSKKISNLCKKYNYIESKLHFIDDLYDLGDLKLAKNHLKLSEIEAQIKENDVVTISYTSGTTGNPKGIMLTHLNYYSNSREAVNTFQIKELISTLIILPTDHSFAHTVGIYTSLVKGLSISFVDARGGGMNALKNIPINLVETNPHFLLTVPALTSNFINKIKEGIKAKGSFIEGIFNRGMQAAIKRNGDGYTKPNLFIQLLTYPSYILAKKLIFNKLKLIFGSNINFFVGGGALLDIKQQQFYKAIGIPVYQGYGLTEAAPIISTNTPFAHKMGTSGMILDNITCKICNDNRQELPKGIKGEIVIKGDNVMKAYYKNQQASDEALQNGWLYTGDLGYIDPDGFLVVVGREKALLISEDGEKYSPEEIEETIINSSSLILQTMIYNDHKKYTTALVTLDKQQVKNLIKNTNLTDPKELMSKIEKELNLFKNQKKIKNKFPSKWMPSNFQIIADEFSEANGMINSTLKMVRHKITEQHQNRLDMMYPPNTQKDAVAKNIAILKDLFFN